jgi:hypothetical protein
MVNLDWLMFVNQCPQFKSGSSIKDLFYNATNSWYYQGRPASAHQEVVSALDAAGVAWTHSGIKSIYSQGAVDMYSGLVAAAVLPNGSTAEIAAARKELAKKLSSRGNVAIGSAVTIGETLYFWVSGERERAGGAFGVGSASVLTSVATAMVVGGARGAMVGGVAGAVVGMGGSAVAAWAEVVWSRHKMATHHRHADSQLCGHLDHLQGRYGYMGMREHDALEGCKSGCFEDYFIH